MLLIVLSLSVSVVSSHSTPHWEELNCEAGHKYLFSQVLFTWEEARGECELYGGWLVDVRTRKEQNCLLRYAQSMGLEEDWYWHDVNTVEAKGVFMHSKDDTEADWVADWSCSGSSNVVYGGQDHVLVGIFYNSYPMVTGFWCDSTPNALHHFICKSTISHPEPTKQSSRDV